jgi:tRNA1(Val) A37 N6-methylase TrmN6
MDVTDDAVLGGRLRLLQPAKGHRFGHDAILLAGAVEANDGDHVVELGSGVGAAGLALAHRLPGLRVTLVEIDPALVALASDNIERNGLAGRVEARLLDVTAPFSAFAESGLARGGAQGVIMNPPFTDTPRHQTSPDTARALAHASAPGELRAWIETAKSLLSPRGTLTMIWRADSAGAVLDALSPDFAVNVMPVHGRRGGAAIRILVRAQRGATSPPQRFAPLVLTETDGQPTVEAEDILRHAKALQFVPS